MSLLLSVVVPLYNEELVLNELYKRLSQVLKENGIEYEIILVNDGSQDRTVHLAEKICRKDKSVKLINFSRNFGQQVAITAGIDRSAGEAIVIIDADLQDPPEVIPQMVKKWREGFQVVYGVREKRKGESFFKTISATLFYRVLKKMTAVDIPLDTGDFRLMDKKIVAQLKKMRERARFVRGMVSWIGFKQSEVVYVREERFAGETKYPLKKMLKFAKDGILSFSQTPLKISTALGFSCSIISFIFISYGLINKLLFPSKVIVGWASTFVSILFIGGVQLICLGIIGEYLGRIYEEIKQRPIYIVDDEINF